MKYTEIISIAGHSIEAMGVLVVIFGAVISTAVFTYSIKQIGEHRESG